jgi:hypothetical protein
MGSVDPWSLDYYDENKIPIIGTSDIRLYCVVDDESIYSLDCCFISQLFNGNEEVDVSWEEFEDILESKGKFIKNKSDIEKDAEYWKKWK